MSQQTGGNERVRVAAEDRTLAHVLTGATAGIAATAVMTAALLVQAAVTRGELEPKRITEWVVARLGLELSEPALDFATGVNHLAFGTSMGALYGLWRGRRDTAARPALSGVAYGIGVWASSYAGWVPALGIMPPPHRDKPGRAARIHVSHWIYGATLGAVEAGLTARYGQRRGSPDDA